MKINLNRLLRCLRTDSNGFTRRLITRGQLCELNDNQELDLNFDELLARRRQIALIWSIEDVQGVRDDLNDNQAWEVLKRCEKSHDCNFGLTWEWIEHIADQLFPRPAEGENQ